MKKVLAVYGKEFYALFAHRGRKSHGIEGPGSFPYQGSATPLQNPGKCQFQFTTRRKIHAIQSASSVAHICFSTRLVNRCLFACDVNALGLGTSLPSRNRGLNEGSTRSRGSLRRQYNELSLQCSLLAMARLTGRRSVYCGYAGNFLVSATTGAPTLLETSQRAAKVLVVRNQCSRKSSPGNGPLFDAALQFGVAPNCFYHYVPVIFSFLAKSAGETTAGALSIRNETGSGVTGGLCFIAGRP